ncbi:unnamed protein product [Pleuronectes platessa]|uniref:Uncharacterized protein n=1 Tax=Pleuronectes platessa TaxID=8262 RepID=A0A9N7VLK9_PLEPL|nr:unnamed protein product [Pleuronectes platessa]
MSYFWLFLFSAKGSERANMRTAEEEAVRGRVASTWIMKYFLVERNIKRQKEPHCACKTRLVDTVQSEPSMGTYMLSGCDIGLKSN